MDILKLDLFSRYQLFNIEYTEINAKIFNQNQSSVDLIEVKLI